MMATYGVRVNDDGRLLARVVAEDADGADVAALLAVDSAITGEAPPAALRTAPGDVDADGQIEVLVEVRRLVDGQADMAAGDRRRMLVVADHTGILGAAHRPDAMIFGAFLARSGKDGR